jgi:hypothetical protein
VTERIDPALPQVLCVTPSASGGWQPVVALAELVARLWESTPTFLHPSRDYSVARKLLSVVPRARGKRPPLLIIAAHPGDLLSLADTQVLLGHFSQIGAWVIDSFWDERIPLFARLGRTIDRVWITDAELVDHYADVMKVPCGWAPWGSDALAVHGLPSAERDIDVLRLGRQPTAWEDDTKNQRFFADHRLTYEGRFPAAAGANNQQQVRDHLLRAKVVLASSNLASPAPYTHPTREYITARFTDAVACGTLIAGQPPRCRAAELLPKAGLVAIDVTSREAGLSRLKAAVDGWSAATADSIHAHALTHLDWRHRVRHLAEDLGVTTPTMTSELAMLDDAIAEGRPANPNEEVQP